MVAMDSITAAMDRIMEASEACSVEDQEDFISKPALQSAIEECDKIKH